MFYQLKVKWKYTNFNNISLFFILFCVCLSYSNQLAFFYHLISFNHWCKKKPFYFMVKKREL